MQTIAVGKDKKEILLYSTGNSITYDGAWQCEKKECIHLSMTGSSFCAVENLQNAVNELSWKNKNHYSKKKSRINLPSLISAIIRN